MHRPWLHYNLFFVAAIALLSGIYCNSAKAQAPPAQPTQQQIQQQIIQMAHPHPAGKEVLRYEVDAKRMGVDPMSDDALPRSREFKRTDSTYYVGWLFEGAYKYNHAADYLGFRNASLPLERALALIERDYRKQLATHTADVIGFIPVYKFQVDYTMIAYLLMNCYSNMELPDKVYTLLRRDLRWNFQRNMYLDAYNLLGWTVHRNRFYTDARYPFLKNTIADNERLAQSYLDSQMRQIIHNESVNAHIFQPGYDAADKLGVYHYKNILYSYAFNIDSAEHYFDLMRGSAIFPHNNYATFRAVCGDFRTAEKEYKEASQQETGDKRLKEWAYYTSILDIYKSQPKDGAELMKDMIKATGSTPGFGWYNLALGRALMYDGQTEEAERYVKKAEGFKELHLGTTLGQSQYDFSIQLVHLMDKQNAWEAQRFENRNWWYNPAVLGRMAELVSQKYLQQFLIISQFSQNPERDRVIYKLFSTESTVTWDEVWYLIRDFSTQFFLDRFRKEAATDKRRLVHKYFQYFVARLEMKQGNYKDAQRLLDEVLHAPATDLEYEKLFVARVCQAQAECARELKQEPAFNDWLYRVYLLYPQLLPYSGMAVNMGLHIIGQADPLVTTRLKACNINWVTNTAIPAPQVYITFRHSGAEKFIDYYVLDRSGGYVVPRQSLSYRNATDAGVNLAFALFNIGGSSPNTKGGDQ
ncbi:MAG: hypothetical protein H0X33_02400 [Taibaiella sp.]|nr:hypothetical protein [Taibaiella sp.]